MAPDPGESAASRESRAIGPNLRSVFLQRSTWRISQFADPGITKTVRRLANTSAASYIHHHV